MTDWETFCAFEYELLMVETETGSADGYTDDIMFVFSDFLILKFNNELNSAV